MVLLATACAGAFGVALGMNGAATRPDDSEFATRAEGRTVLDQVRNLLAGHYYRRVPAGVLRRPTVASILAGLDDPHTSYLTPAAVRVLRRHTSASYTGIGLSVDKSELGLVVTAAPPGPARRAGIRAGDTIVSVDGTRTAGLSLTAAVARILGRQGTAVRLRILRRGSYLRFRVVRARIDRTALATAVVRYGGRSFGVMTLAAFPQRTASAVRRALRRFDRARVDGLVLDLRENPGGLLEEAVGVSSAFLRRGVVATLHSVHDARHVHRVSGRVIDARRPLVVLVDRYSASAAEVTAAALRDNGRARIVGERTFGKAVVQSVEPLRGGAALKFTTAAYVTPAGADISRTGLRPDLLAVDNPATRHDEGLAVALTTLSS